MGRLTEARRLWRKCIRQIIRANRQKTNAVGVLKSRALKGHSIADRLKRMEEKTYAQVRDLKRELDGNTESDNVRDELIETLAQRVAGQHKRAKFPTSKAPISAVFHSFQLIFGRAIISRDGLAAWMLLSERARAEHSR